MGLARILRSSALLCGKRTLARVSFGSNADTRRNLSVPFSLIYWGIEWGKDLTLIPLRDFGSQASIQHLLATGPPPNPFL